ncbi:cytochrome P450 [Marinococcus halophilus]|uniref:cytochrome P450 n=1 Tax=Marinococcus halophilus TaxID=1371 RepID=UPI0009A73644|nr:cytochrome P450 [Marinococcus halophilus]
MPESKQIPREEGIEHTLDFLKEGYLFVSNRSHGFQSNIFETRLLGEPVICMRGEEEGQLFYDESKFRRDGAAPKRILKTLFGEGGVQTLDGEAHKHRKAAFMSLMSGDRLEEMRRLTRERWEEALTRWERREEIVLYDEALTLLFKAACDWAGVPFRQNEAKEKAQMIRLMIESTSSIGPNHWKGRRARTQAEEWIKEIITDVREGKLHPREQTALYVFAWHRDLDGELLDTHTAAVEVLNIVRPIVAVAIYVDFTALAVHQHSSARERLASKDEQELKMFVQEVRRFYPFFPFVPARVRDGFTWNDYAFPKNRLVLLDLYGTNHHPDLWNNPEKFDPTRFQGWKESPFSFIPQGGGDYDYGHRCAGEWITVEIMKEGLDYLANRMTYGIPEQDVSYSFNDMPALPHSKMIMKHVTRK